MKHKNIGENKEVFEKEHWNRVSYCVFSFIFTEKLYSFINNLSILRYLYEYSMIFYAYRRTFFEKARIQAKMAELFKQFIQQVYGKLDIMN